MAVITRAQLANMATAPIRNIWSKNGLDLSDSAFSKIFQNESTFTEKDDQGDNLKKFELESNRFEELRTLLIQKQNRMALKKLLKVQEGGVDLEILEQPQLISKATMVTQRDTIWNAAVDLVNDTQATVNTVFDKQLKCHAIGLWIVDALTNRAQQKLECSKSEWTVEKDDEIFIHGPLLFWFIVDAVKPNNDTLVQQTKEKLMQLKAKNFGHSVKEMLVEFENLCTEVEVRLKGQVTEDEKISALWKALESMQDEHFARVVSDEKRSYRREPVATRKTHSELIEVFKREQTDLEADGKWNKPNKDQQILALTSVLQSVVKQVNNVRTHGWNGNGNGNGTRNNNGNGNSNGNGNVNGRDRRTRAPAWKYKREDGQTTITKDGKQYWWCDKHTNPETGSKGMWVRHKPEDHKDNFFSKAASERNNELPGQSNTSSSPAPPNSSDTPSVQVDSRLFTALRSGADVQSYLDALQNNGTTLNE